MKNKKLIYITGFGRSGSTLLDRLLGQVQGVFSGGEISPVWVVGMVDNDPCGCGKSFHECDIWKKVVKQVRAEHGEFDARKEFLFQLSVYKRRTFLKWLLPWKTRAFKKKLAHAQKYIQTLYDAIYDASGASVIVDSSKHPIYPILLSRLSGIDLTIVHIVRDSRAVAYSWTRKKKKIDSKLKIQYLSRHNPLKSAINWLSYNILCESLKFILNKKVNYKLVKYENLAKNPRNEIEQILKISQIYDYSLDFIKDGRVNLNVNHTITGNPMRFQQGAIPLVLDDEWKAQMTLLSKFAVTLPTIPLLIHYYYPIKSIYKKHID